MLWLVAWLAGCECGREEPPDPLGVGHFAGYDGLVDAVARGKTEAARDAASRLATEDHGNTPEAERIGGLVGFAGFADDEELLELTVAVALACRSCHEARDVIPPVGVPSWQHESAARAAAAQVIWGLAPRGRRATEFVVAPRAAEGDARLLEVLRGCRACHAAP